MSAEIPEHDVETLRLPRNWHSYLRSAVLNIVGIVRVDMLAGREALIENDAAKDARIHQLESEVGMLREDLRIVSARGHRVRRLRAIAARAAPLRRPARIESSKVNSPLASVLES
jgi:hypothetical protein